MLFDTDIFIWIQRGNSKAAAKIDIAQDRYLSIQSYMELLQGAVSKKQHQYTKSFLIDLDFIILPLTENIGHRAAVYIEEYSLSFRVQPAFVFPWRRGQFSEARCS